eukprot:TRINITY_DN1925_c0_g1_i1.p1 TRINITY_DN1925_c0_g1~~TRINITY_DN1925_c0_g1_i1.p1  ORF type:complete len:481 (-),score=44.15 TRINITY_DN1925_c0_g1_i1:198-1640(-)
MSLIHEAVSKGHPGILESLIAAGIDPDVRDRKGKTPLHVASASGNNDCVSILIRAGARAVMHKCNGLTPLHVAAAAGHTLTVALLVANGADPLDRDHKGETAVHLAARGGHVGVLKQLAGCLEECIHCGHKSIAALSDTPEATSNKSIGAKSIFETPFEAKAELHKSGRIVVRAVQSDIDEGMVCQEMLCQSGLPVIECSECHCIEGGVNSKIETAANTESTHFTSSLETQSSNVSVAWAYQGSETVTGVEQRDVVFTRCATTCAQCCPISVIPASVGSLLNVRTNNGRTALHSAARNGHLAVVNWLLSHGALPFLEDSSGSCPLHEAAANGSTECMRALLAAGASATCQDSAGCTPLHHAAAKGHLDSAKLLVNFGVDVTVRDKSFSCPVYWAASQGQSEMLTRLLQLPGLSANSSNCHRTALHAAVGWGHAPAVAVLLEAGADRKAVDSQRKTPLDLYLSLPPRRQSAKVLSLLRNWG